MSTPEWEFTVNAVMKYSVGYKYVCVVDSR